MRKIETIISFQYNFPEAKWARIFTSTPFLFRPRKKKTKRKRNKNNNLSMVTAIGHNIKLNSNRHYSHLPNTFECKCHFRSVFQLMVFWGYEIIAVVQMIFNISSFSGRTMLNTCNRKYAETPLTSDGGEANLCKASPAR